MALTIDNLEIQVQANSLAASNGIDALRASLERLKGAVGGSSKITSNINSISSSLERLKTASKVNLGPVSSGMAKLKSSAAGLTTANGRLSNSYNSLFTRMAYFSSRTMILYYAMRRIANVFGNCFNESNEYIESLNLFKVSMGEAADSALKYAETVGSLMGIDPAEWITNQGVFQRMATGFGISSDKAEVMSQNLTQLGYDMASFFNTDVETAMDKIQSGMTGQIKGLKAWGYNLSVAALEETALSLGIKQKVRTMTEAQKAQLRYITLIKRSNGIMGDMARTIITPANSMRVLNAQIEQMKRAFGNVISVFATKVIPYVRAFVELVTEGARNLATLWGFTLPEIDYSGLELGSDVADDLGDSLDSATSSAKKLKQHMLGIDELNVLSESGSSGAGSGSGNIYDLGIDLPEYDFLNGLVQDTSDIKENMREFFDMLGPVATALAALGVYNLIVSIGTAMSQMGLLKKSIASAVVIALEFKVSKWSMEGFLEKGDLKNILMNVFSASAASYLLYRAWGPTGLIIGVGVAIAANIISISTEVSQGLTMDDPKLWISTALTTAMGGIIGGIGLSKIGFFAGEGFVISATVTLALTLTGINFGGISGAQWNAGSWQSIILSAVSTVAAGVGGYVLAGALFAGAGPIGLAIGLGVGLILNIVSVSIAEDQARSIMVHNTFYDDQGVLIADLADEYDELITKLGEAQEPILSAWAAIGSSKDSIESTVSNIANLSKQVELGYKDIQTTMPLIKAEFVDLYEDSREVLRQEAELIYMALAGSTGQALVDMGYNLEEAGLVFSAFVNNTTVEVERLEKEKDKLIAAMEAGTMSQLEGMQKLRENADEIARLTGTSTTELDGFRDKLANLFPEDINWENADVTAIFNDIAGAANEAKTSIEESTDALIAIMEQNKTISSSPVEVLWFDRIIEAAEKDRDDKIAQLEQITSEFLGTLQTDLITSAEEQVNAALEEWDSMSWLDKVIGGYDSEADYVRTALETYKKDVVTPITDDMKAAFSDSLSGDQVWAENAMNALLDSLFDMNYSGAMSGAGTKATYSETFARGVKEAIDAVLPGEMATAGKNGAEGLAKGITDNTNLATTAATNMITGENGVLNAVDTALDAHSPAKELVSRGLWIDQGLANGITDNAHLAATAATDMITGENGVLAAVDAALGMNSVAATSSGPWSRGSQICQEIAKGITDNASAVSTAMNNMLNALISKMETFANNCRSAINSMLGDIKGTMASVNVSSGGSVSYTPSTNKYIPRFADGGFPAMGSMFIANEAGPELVGTINGKTAVANDEQIISGIQRGVSEANSEQNALLREQNALLTAILAKTGTYINGKQITDVVEKTQRERGVSITSGGVMTT